MNPSGSGTSGSAEFGSGGGSIPHDGGGSGGGTNPGSNSDVDQTLVEKLRSGTISRTTLPGRPATLDPDIYPATGGHIEIKTIGKGNRLAGIYPSDPNYNLVSPDHPNGRDIHTGEQVGCLLYEIREQGIGALSSTKANNPALFDFVQQIKSVQLSSTGSFKGGEINISDKLINVLGKR